MTEESLRIGTWNILSFDDEYNIEYGCPLSIAWCPDRNETTTANCTRQRYERIWNVLEEQTENFDIVCLQEVSDEFFTIQQQQAEESLSSNWTVVERNQECAVLKSNASPWQIVTSFNVTNVPSLSGCRDLPMVVLQSPQQQQQQQQNSTISYLVGSVHVQASVPNMSVWYQATIAAILNTTNYYLGEEEEMGKVEEEGGGTDWMQYPVLMIVGGDFNHNLTSPTTNNNNATTTIESPPEPWTLVAPTDILVLGTTQKEYNYMGLYDGFLVSSTSMLLQQQPLNATDSTNLTDRWSFNATNTSVYMKGFMPKVVYGFPQDENRTIQTTAQFALISTTQDNRTFWNATMMFVPEYTNDTLSDLQLLFSPSSDFTSANDTIVVPSSHPIHEALSDHLFVSATFTASSPSSHNNSSTTTSTNTTKNNDNNSTSNGNDTIDTTSKSSTFLSQLTPFGRTCVYMSLAVMAFLVLRCCCCCWRGRRRNATMAQDLDRVSLTNNNNNTPPPPSIQ